MDMILGKCKFPNSFLPYFQYNMSMRQFQCVPTTYIFTINEFFTISFLTLTFIQRNEHVEMNKFSCSLSCTWMTIINCLYHAYDSLS